MIAGWYFFFFMPLTDQTELTTARIGRELKRIATAREIEQLKKDLGPYQGLIPVGANLSELMRQVIDHLRSSPLKLIDLKPGTAKRARSVRDDWPPACARGRVHRDRRIPGLDRGRRTTHAGRIDQDRSQSTRPGRLKAQLTLLSLAEKTPADPKTKPQHAEPGPQNRNSEA